MPAFAWVLSGIGAIGAIIGIIWFVESRFRKPVDPEVVERVEKKVDELRREVGQIHEYLDGLPEAPRKIRDPFNEARKLEGEYEYREAIKLYEACFQPETTASQRASLHILIGNCFLRLSELEEAEGHYKEAETAARQANDRRGLAAVLGNMGVIYETRGDKENLDKALDYHQQALNIYREIGYREGEASVLGNIGNIFFRKGELDKALDYHQQALKVYRDMMNREGEAKALTNMGLIHYLKKGGLDKALDYHQQALRIDREMGHREGEAKALGGIGLVHAAKGNPNTALEHLEQARKIFEEIGAKIEVEGAKQCIQRIRESMKRTGGQKSDPV